ncbi:hypothetical protein CRG98_029524 [Punica granatum]|uniref:Uncharacterized protein n=1 Tax=Punica granatum TaxID=22663 RepID=A0A2I0J2Z8_PUNGR|nr:hypothetical protein CRG98_029524 [Punica granatum]
MARDLGEKALGGFGYVKEPTAMPLRWAPWGSLAYSKPWGSSSHDAVTCYTGFNAPNHRTRGPTPPNSPSACNPSAEWDLASIHRYTPNAAYVEGNLDRACETNLDITRELNRPNGYSGNQPSLLQTIGSIGPDPRLFEPALP